MLEKYKNEVAKSFRNLRASENVTQKEIAIRAGVDVMTVARYENNSCSMLLDTIEKIANAYGLDLLIFFENINANMHKSEG